MLNFVGQIAEDGLLVKRDLNTPSVLLCSENLIVQKMAERICGIYKIQSIRNPERIYIGSSVNLYHRWETHKSDLKKNKHASSKLQHHYNKYGEEDLIYAIVLTCEKEDLIPEDGVVWIEQCFIWAYHYEGDNKPYFNISPTAGSCLGHKHSLETRQKQSISARNKPPMTDETKKKMSIAQSQRTMPIEIRQKLSVLKKRNSSCPVCYRGCKTGQFREKTDQGNEGKKIKHKRNKRYYEQGQTVTHVRSPSQGRHKRKIT